ncbi:Bacterioferritin [Shigella boydii ATCC 9905]|nr:Bacterioferritin [Shigella boydii ATCC 9905]
MSINIDGRDCCQTGQFSQDVADGALTLETELDLIQKMGLQNYLQAQIREEG